MTHEQYEAALAELDVFDSAAAGAWRVRREEDGLQATLTLACGHDLDLTGFGGDATALAGAMCQWDRGGLASPLLNFRASATSLGAALVRVAPAPADAYPLLHIGLSASEKLALAHSLALGALAPTPTTGVTA